MVLKVSQRILKSMFYTLTTRKWRALPFIPWNLSLATDSLMQ